MDNTTSIPHPHGEVSSFSVSSPDSFGSTPDELKSLRQWVLWQRKAKSGGGFAKVPTSPSGFPINAHEPQNWLAFEEALNAHQEGKSDGIGFDVTESDPYCGIDLDHVYDPQTGGLEPWAAEIVAACDSYTEVTPSGDGVRIWTKARCPGSDHDDGKGFEIYDRKRFFTVTGQHLPGTPTTVEERQVAVDYFYRKRFPDKANCPPNGKANGAAQSSLSDEGRAQILAELHAALPSIPADEHETWLRVGMGLHSVDAGEVGLDEWVTWSKTCPEKFDLDDCRKRWRSFHDDGGITHKTIFDLAIKYGWRGDAHTPRTGQAEQKETEQTGAKKQPKPDILISTDMTAVVDAAEKAVATLSGGPHIFQRTRHLVMVARNTKTPSWLTRPLDAPIIAFVEAVQLRERMNQAATWLKYHAREDEWKPALPPEWAVETLLKRLDWLFPVLTDIISSPTIRPDGELITAPGYDKQTGLFLDTQGVVFPQIATRPSRDDAIDAVLALKEPFVDFPFAAPHGLSTTLASLLSIVARPAINGCVPLSAVRATTRGSGKGLLVDAVATIATGRSAPRWPQVHNDDEERKRLLTLGLDGDASIHIDNVTTPLGSGPLDSALTATTFKDRLLGVNKTLEVPMRAVFFASGNNMTFKGDTARRVVPIDLDPGEERPEDRTGFVYPQLLAWVQQERPRLVCHALTVLRAYFVAGCPKQHVAYGSFEGWNDLIRSALIWADLPDPCEGRRNIEEESDLGYATLQTLLDCWLACYGNEAKTLNAALQDIGIHAVDTPSVVTPVNEWNELKDALGAFDPKFDGKRLDSRRIGYGLRVIRGRVLGGKRLIEDGKTHGMTRWRVETLKA